MESNRQAVLSKEPISEVKIPLRAENSEVFLTALDFGEVAGEEGSYATAIGEVAGEQGSNIPGIGEAAREEGSHTPGKQAVNKNEAAGSSRPAVIIVTGGGYYIVGTSEGKPVARRFAEAGFKTFILNYSIKENACYACSGVPKPVEDLQMAATYIKENKESLGIDQDKIYFAGFSAGAHLTLSYFKHLKEDTPRPAGLFITYPLVDFRHSTRVKVNMTGSYSDQREKLFSENINGNLFSMKVPSQEVLDKACALGPESKDFPPTYICHGLDDAMVEPESTRLLAQRLESLGVAHLVHYMERSTHGQPFAFGDAWFYKGLDWLVPRGS